MVVSKFRLVTVSGRSFSGMSPKLWTALAQALHLCSLFSSFMINLIIILFSVIPLSFLHWMIFLRSVPKHFSNLQ